MTETTDEQNSSDTVGEEGVSANGVGTSQDDAVGSESFDRDYVRKLRDEAAGHRVKAKRADALRARLATAQTALRG